LVAIFVLGKTVDIN
jgi:uncharacterized membrane-anchored protein YitT (DUF2179 family)